MAESKNLPPLEGLLFQEFSGNYKRWKDGLQSAEDFRKTMKMPKGVFYHYLKDYIALCSKAIEAEDGTYIEGKENGIIKHNS